MAHYTASDNETLKMCNAWNMEHNVQSFNINIDIAMGNAILWTKFCHQMIPLHLRRRLNERFISISDEKHMPYIYIYISIKHQMSIIITTVLHDSRCRNSRTSHPIHCNSNDLFNFYSHSRSIIVNTETLRTLGTQIKFDQKACIYTLHRPANSNAHCLNTPKRLMNASF